MAASAVAGSLFYLALARGGGDAGGNTSVLAPQAAFWRAAGPALGGLALVGAVALGAVVDAAWLALAVRRGAVPPGPRYPGLAFVLLLVVGGLGGSLSLALQVRGSVVAAYRVPNASMAPAVPPGSRVLAAVSAYRQAPPSVGDIVLFANPALPAQTWVKRVVAVGGQTVEVRAGRVWVDGRPVTSGGAGTPGSVGGKPGVFLDEGGYRVFVADESGEAEAATGPLTVPEHYVFVLGDNRSASRDSRHFGTVPWTAMRGRVAFTF
jgi:signal peptidase I